jgi:hypothetical protein
VNVAFAGAFSVRMAERVRAHLGIPCDVILADEAAIVPRMPEVDVLVTLAFTQEMGAAARRLKLVQVPGARGRPFLRAGRSTSCRTCS